VRIDSTMMLGKKKRLEDCLYKNTADLAHLACGWLCAPPACWAALVILLPGGSPSLSLTATHSVSTACLCPVLHPPGLPELGKDGP
jgi:hypothetical protein